METQEAIQVLDYYHPAWNFTEILGQHNYFHRDCQKFSYYTDQWTFCMDRKTCNPLYNFIKGKEFTYHKKFPKIHFSYCKLHLKTFKQNIKHTFNMRTCILWFEKVLQLKRSNDFKLITKKVRDLWGMTDTNANSRISVLLSED